MRSLDQLPASAGKRHVAMREAYATPIQQDGAPVPRLGGATEVRFLGRASFPYEVLSMRPNTVREVLRAARASFILDHVRPSLAIERAAGGANVLNDQAATLLERAAGDRSLGRWETERHRTEGDILAAFDAAIAAI